MTIVSVTRVSGSRWAARLSDAVAGTHKLGTYARKTTALRGARRALSANPAPVLNRNADGTWSASASFPNGTLVPVGNYQRRATALRGFSRFCNRLQSASFFSANS